MHRDKLKVILDIKDRLISKAEGISKKLESRRILDNQKNSPLELEGLMEAKNHLLVRLHKKKILNQHQ